jgi:hypothetical protein
MSKRELSRGGATLLRPGSLDVEHAVMMNLDQVCHRPTIPPVGFRTFFLGSGYAGVGKEQNSSLLSR